MAEPVLWVAAFRALYLQALHPRVMRGTWQHTGFADPKQAWGRFLRTSEYVRVRTYGSLAEVDPATVPASMAGLDEYFAAMRPRLRATREARQAVARSVNPVALPAPNLPLKLLTPVVSGLGFATLPRWARRLFGIPASPLTDLTATASLRALHEAIARGPGDRLVLPATRAARDRAWAIQRWQLRRVQAAS